MLVLNMSQHCSFFLKQVCGFFDSSLRAPRIPGVRACFFNFKIFLGLCLCIFVLAGCSTSPPKNPDNICSIFEEKPSWRKYADKASNKWGVPPQILFAILAQESGFNSKALPPKNYFLGIVPWGRVSSAAGYPQAKDEVWSDYEKAVDHSASRTSMEDSLDFIGWYADVSSRKNGVSKWDTYNLYLNYHEGWGGYSRKTYAQKGWLLKVARNVSNKASTYGAQLKNCPSG